MRESLLIELQAGMKNFYWAGGTFRPPLALSSRDQCRLQIAEMQGQFSLVAAAPGADVVLIRDKLGLNKLFFALHESGRVVTGNYLIHLVEKGVPLNAIFSVPAGHWVEMDVARRTLSLKRYFDRRAYNDSSSPTLENAARTIRRDLERWFSRLAEQFGSRRVCLSLSGGLDSGLIAALAKKYFAKLTAYTYMHDGPRSSEDASHAEKLAKHLEIPWQLVTAGNQDILDAVEPALIYGQDWRDFNVHCAIVNVILAKRISSERRTGPDEEPPLVLSGDLANEFLADYSPVFYNGREFYKLPKVSMTDLRLILVRGLDAGDREIGIFNHFGLDVIQPYGFLVDDYLRLPESLLYREKRKQDLVREIAGDLLPSFLFDRPKVRAQIGTSGVPTGILPVLIDSGRDSAWLKSRFCRLFGIKDERFLNCLIRAGLYRFMDRFPNRSTS